MPLLRFIPETTNVNFVKYRFAAFGIDGLLLVISLISIFWHGFNLGIDFTGGVLMNVKSAQVIDISKMRADVNSLGFPESQLQYAGGGDCDKPANSCVMIRVQPKDIKNVKAGIDQNEADQAVVSAIKGKLGSSVQYRSTEVVGPKVSGELLNDGILATILAVAMISIYVAVRFEWQYGVGALIATGHDVLVTAGFFSVVGLDFNINTVASLLLLAGYSINDTVVVFDRIRENRRKYKRMSLIEMINLSTNQIATRTTLVSAATALSVIPLLFGGPVLFNFSVAILFGIVVGTFSSTYVAAMLLLYMPAVGGGNVEGKAEEATA
ncbi:MAG: protein translocase subunit SecF [Alphaproteobacteria bacterium]|nr:protein translocase subunit SecF [Alphaproteobacteria bacterium]